MKRFHRAVQSLCVSLMLAGTGLAAGCVSYSPDPVDLRQHDRAWRDRSPSGAGVKEWADRLFADSPSSIYDPSDGLDLNEACAVALLFNVDARIARAQAGVALADAGNAGRWDDPEFHIEIGSILANVDRPFLLSAGIGITIPLSGRAGAERDRAIAEHGVSMALAFVAELEALASLRRTWRELAAARERLSLIESLISDIETAHRQALAGHQAGKLKRADARLFEIELESRRIEQAREAANTSRLESQALSLMGLAP